MTIFLNKEQEFLGLSQRIDIKQGSGTREWCCSLRSRKKWDTNDSISLSYICGLDGYAMIISIFLLFIANRLFVLLGQIYKKYLKSTLNEKKSAKFTKMLCHFYKTMFFVWPIKKFFLYLPSETAKLGCASAIGVNSIALDLHELCGNNLLVLTF